MGCSFISIMREKLVINIYIDKNDFKLISYLPHKEARKIKRAIKSKKVG